MKRSVLSASQRIEVVALIKTSTNLKARDFRWAVVNSQKTKGTQVARVEYVASSRRFFFQFDRYKGRHYAIYSLGSHEEVEEHFLGSWEQQVLHFARWAARLDDELRHTRETLADCFFPEGPPQAS